MTCKDTFFHTGLSTYNYAIHVSQPPDGIIICAQASVKKGESSLSNNGSPCHDVGVGSGDWGGGGGGALDSQARHDGRCVHSIFDRCHHRIFIRNNDHF